MSHPPHYILFAHRANALGHPAVQYHYADDNPAALLPASPDEHVLVLDHNPDSPHPPTVMSLSPKIAVTNIRIEDAPGTSIDEDGQIKASEKMHIIETSLADDR
jgi:hypothetical protein